jgi:hypothetical protein
MLEEKHGVKYQAVRYNYRVIIKLSTYPIQELGQLQ